MTEVRLAEFLKIKIEKVLAHSVLEIRLPLAAEPALGNIRSKAFRTFDFIPDAPHTAYFEIVGVVSDFQNTHLREPVIPEAFLPYTITAGGGRTILVRTALDPKAALRTISQSVGSSRR